MSAVAMNPALAKFSLAGKLVLVTGASSGLGALAYAAFWPDLTDIDLQQYATRAVSDDQPDLFAIA